MFEAVINKSSTFLHNYIKKWMFVPVSFDILFLLDFFAVNDSFLLNSYNAVFLILNII